LNSALEYISSRTVQNVEEACQQRGREDSSTFPLWAIIAIVVGGLVILGVVSGL